jgi:hypothetical protein
MIRQDIVITSASGYTFTQLLVWLNSLERSGFAGECVVIVGNRQDDVVAQLEARRCTVVQRESLLDAAGKRERSVFVDSDMSVERFFLFWLVLQQRSVIDTRYVIAVDVRDAFFQLNPAEWLAAHLSDKRLVVSSEAMTFQDQPWNRENLRQAFDEHVFRYMHDQVVWNCGTVAGELSFFRDLALNVFLSCIGRNVPYSDQASLNVLLSLEAYREHVLFDTGDLGWACQAGTMTADGRGAELSYRFRGAEPLFDGDAVFTSRGTPYCVVHQYDRVPRWKDHFEQKYG